MERLTIPTPGALLPSAPIGNDGAADAAVGVRERRQAATRRRDAFFRRSLLIADCVAVLAAMALSLQLIGGNTLTPGAFLVPLLFVIGAKAMRLYDHDEHRLHKTTLDEIPALFGITTLTTLSVFIAGEWISSTTPTRAQTFLLLVLLFASLPLLRSLSRFAARKLTTPERCLLVGNSTRQLVLYEALGTSPATHAQIVGTVPVPVVSSDQAFLRMPSVADELIDELMIDRVVILPGSQTGGELMFAIRELRDAGVKVSLLPDITRLVGSSVEVDNVGGVTLFGMRRFAISRSSQLIKRSFDVLVAATMMTLLAPVMIAIAIAVRLDSSGPSLYRQERIGRHGSRFRMYKFRSMVVGAHSRREELRGMSQSGERLFKIAEDPRVTRVGGWIRRTSLDELPQLINVLKGDMSLVGPRPLVPEEDEQIVGSFRDRLDARPGITGHWQILGSFRVSLPEMVKLDYLYVANWSLWNDIVLLLRTVPVVLRRHGR